MKNREDLNVSYYLVVYPGDDWPATEHDYYIDDRRFNSYFRAWWAKFWYELARPVAHVDIHEYYT